MTAGHSNILIVSLFLFFYLAVLNSCGLSDLKYHNDLSDVEECYQQLIHVENNYERMNELWRINKELQIGNSPKRIIRDNLESIDYNLAIAGKHSAKAKKNAYIDLIHKYGLCYSLLETEYFSSAELKTMLLSEQYKSTKLLRDR